MGKQDQGFGSEGSEDLEMCRVLVVVVFFKGRRVLEFSPLKESSFLGNLLPKIGRSGVGSGS